MLKKNGGYYDVVIYNNEGKNYHNGWGKYKIAKDME